MSEKDEDKGINAVRLELREATMPTANESEDEKDRIYKWGSDNLYPQWLNWLFNNNAIHSGIIRSKVIYTVSGGLAYKGPDQEQWELFLKNGGSDFDLNDVVERLSLDYEISNRFIVKGKRDFDTGICTKIEWIDFETARNGLENDNLYVSEDWSDSTVKRKLYKPLDLSGTNKEREFYILYEEQPKQAFLNKPDSYGNKNIGSQIVNRRKSQDLLSKGIYPSPPYSGGLKAINTGIAIDEYQLSEITNGFSLGTVVNLNDGQPNTKADKDAIKAEFKNNASGESNGGGMILLFNNGKDQAATIESLQGNNLNERYLNVDKGSIKKTLQSHSITTPILFGVKEEGSLGNATELRIGYEVMKRNYFKKRQKALLSVLNFIGKKCNGLKGEITFNEVVLDLSDGETEAAPSQEVVLKVEQANEKTKQELLLFELANVGKVIDRTKILYSVPVENSEIQDEHAIDKFLKESFQDLTEVQNKALVMISGKNDTNTIKNELNLSSQELADIYAKLKALQYLDDDGQITQNGILTAAKSEVGRLRVVYSYEKRPDAPALVPGGQTRDFCQTLLDLDRVYTRSEINQISQRQGYNVFAFKGGWYHNPNTNKNEPFCRHTWKSNIILE